MGLDSFIHRLSTWSWMDDSRQGLPLPEPAIASCPALLLLPSQFIFQQQQNILLVTETQTPVAQKPPTACSCPPSLARSHHTCGCRHTEVSIPP